jgi:hypothetical protein
VIDLRLGSKAGMTLANCDVRFPKSGHSSALSRCQLWAKTGLMHPSKKERYSITLSALARRLGGMVSPSVLQFSPKSVQLMNFLCLTVVSDLPTSMTLIGKS